MPRPVRVAVLDHTAEPGGAELALVRVLERLDPHRVTPVVVLFAEGPLADRVRALGHEVVVVPLAGDVLATDRTAGSTSLLHPGRIAASASFLRRLVAALRRLDVDVVHTTSLKADLAGALAAPLARRPLVWHIHDRLAADYLPARTARLLQTLARRVPYAVVANSAATAATLPGARRLIVVHPGLAPEQVAPAPRTRQPDGPPVVVMVGRISPTKGQLVLVRAARRVADACPAVRFRIVGAPAFGAEAYAATVRDEVRTLSLEGCVELVGFTPDPRAELDRASVAVHAATVPEPFGQVVTEAMAAGVSVVATRGGGVDEIVRTEAAGTAATPDTAGATGTAEQPGATGLLVPPEDPEALAAAVLDVLGDPEAALARAVRAHADVTHRFLAAASAEALTRVWEQAASARNARSGRFASLA